MTGSTTDGARWAFIINPIAGNGFAQQYASTVEARIKEYGVDADIIFTEYPKHAVEISQNCADRGYRYIIGVGGDGTLNEIARPLVGREGITMGIIPAGTGNDTIQILGYPNRFDDHCWKVFFDLNIKKMDVGSCNGKYFLNGMGLGFDAEVAAENYSAPGVVKPGSEKKYIWHIVKTLLFFREREMTVLSGDRKSVSTCFMNTVANGRRFAGGFFITPEAIADDGLLDVCNVTRINLLQRFSLLLKVPKGAHITNPRVDYYKTDALTIEFSKEVPFHLDGELHYANHFDIRIHPGALDIIYNPGSGHYFMRQP